MGSRFMNEEWDSNYIEIDGKRREKESFFERKVLHLLIKESEKYPLLTRQEEQELIEAYQLPRDLLYAEAQRVHGLDRYPIPTSWESPGERGVIKAIITPGSPHYNEGARLAREKMALHNLRLVKRYGKTNKRGDAGMFDTFVAGFSGIFRALDKFDRKKRNAGGEPLKFSTYATWWVKFFASRNQVDQGRTIRIPIHIHDQINKLGKIYAQLSSEHFDSASPNPEQLSKASGMPIDQVKILGLYAADFSLTSLDRETFSDDEEGNTLLDGISNEEPLPEEVAEKEANKEYLHSLIDNSLAPEDAKFCKLFYGLIDGEPRTVREMASALGVSRAEIQKKVDGFMAILQANAEREKVSLD